MNGTEKALNKFIEEFIIGFFSLILKGFKGITKLKSIKLIVAFLLSFFIPWGALRYKAKIFDFMDKLDMPVWLKLILHSVLLIAPFLFLLYLEIADQKKQRKYYNIFKEIGFKGKDGKYPYFLTLKEDNGKNTYVFKSSIPVKSWKDAQNSLESGFDCTITSINNTSSKKIIELQTVSSERKIPVKINWNDDFLSDQDGVLRIGESALSMVEFDLNRTPHVLAAGETGSGKSVILRTCLWQGIKKDWKIYMIDFKGGVEFGKRYEQYGEVITERERALKVLTMLCEENEKRLALFRELEVKNLSEYNKKTNSNLCRIAVFCDEIAEMLDKKGVSKEDKPIFEALEGKLSTLARLSRATGINLFLGVQRPDSNVLTGQIKNNVPVRISGRFADKAASEIVLGNTAAVNLPDIKGRFLYKMGNELIEFQAFYFDDDTMLKEIDREVGDLLIEKNNKLHNPYYDALVSGKVKLKKEEGKEEKTLDLDFDY